MALIIVLALMCPLITNAYYFAEKPWPQNAQVAVDISNSDSANKDQETLDALAETIKKIYDYFAYTHLEMPVDYSDSITPENSDISYHKIRESQLPGESFEALSNMSKALFVDDIADLTYTYYSITEQSPLVYRNEDGLFAHSRTSGNQFYTVQIFNYRQSPKAYFKNMTITDTTATGQVLYHYHADGPLEDQGPLLWFDVAFEKGTDGVWRMDDCSLFRLYFDSNNVNSYDYVCYDKEIYDQVGATYNLTSSPTADPNVSRVWWLAGVSMAAIVPAVCLLRRRRRED